jgi:hypothetical protein
MIVNLHVTSKYLVKGVRVRVGVRVSVKIGDRVGIVNHPIRVRVRVKVRVRSLYTIATKIFRRDVGFVQIARSRLYAPSYG